MNANHQKILIALIAVAALFWWAWQKYEWVEEKKWIGADTELQKRPMYAAGLFLQSLDFSVARIVDQKRFDDIDDSIGTLFICEGKTLLSKKHFREIERWVRHGGHLVVNSAGGGQLNEDEDEIGQQAYGVRSMPIAQLYEDRGISLGNAAASQDCWEQEFDFEPLSASEGELDLSDVLEEAAAVFGQSTEQVFEPVIYKGPLPGETEGRATAVQFEGGNWLEMDSLVQPDWQWGTERGVQLYSLPLDAGRLTVAADFSPFFNRSIGLSDNAFALQSMVEQGSPNSRDVWFHERELAFPTLSSVLWKRAPQVVLSSFTLLVAIIWLLFARRQEPASTTRSYASQLRAQLYSVAFYRWRVGDLNNLYMPLRRSPHSLNSSGDSDKDSVNQSPKFHRSKKFLVESAVSHWQSSKIKRGDS